MTKMSNVKDQVIDEQNAQQPAAQPPAPAKANAPAFLKELQDKGSVVLTAQSRDELSAVVNDIPADVHYGAGAVGYNYDKGEYTLRIDLINKE